MTYPDHPNCDAAHAYALGVIEGKVPACKWVKLACKRYFRDLDSQLEDDWPYRFDPAKAERAMRFVQALPHVKGKWARTDPRTGKPQKITLEPWQKFLLGNIFGWVKKRNGFRRFSVASVYVPRKNAKSTLAASIGWYMLAMDNEPGSEVYCGATTEKQAWEVFGMARQMGLKEPDLLEHTGAAVNAQTITLEDGSKFLPVIGKPGDGSSPHCYIVDEYHEHPDSTLFDTMRTGTGAREQALGLIISTAGDNLAGPCREDWLDCEKLLEGHYSDETKFAVIYTKDADVDWTSERALVQANPNWGVSVNPEMYLPIQQNAIRKPSEQAVFKTKHLNEWVSAKHGWANMEHWRQCGDSALKLEDFKGCDCWIGIDAAAKVDVFSIAAAFHKEGQVFAFCRHFLPEDTVDLPENSHYQRWVAEGWLTKTEGGRTDQRVVEDVLREWSELFNIKSVGYDPRELTYLMSQVSAWAGFPLVELAQGPALMSEPMKELEALISTKRITHNGDPVLNWMMSNVIRKEARGGGTVKYYYPSKEKPENKIDGVVALIMAIQRMKADPGSADLVAFF